MKGLVMASARANRRGRAPTENRRNYRETPRPLTRICGRLLKTPLKNGICKYNKGRQHGRPSRDGSMVSCRRKIIAMAGVIVAGEACRRAARVMAAMREREVKASRHHVMRRERDAQLELTRSSAQETKYRETIMALDGRQSAAAFSERSRKS